MLFSRVTEPPDFDFSTWWTKIKVHPNSGHAVSYTSALSLVLYFQSLGLQNPKLSGIMDLFLNLSFSLGWESQLLETGFLAIFLCPVLKLRQIPVHTPTPLVAIWGYRWLIFRIMLGAVSSVSSIRLMSQYCITFPGESSLQKDCWWQTDNVSM